MKWVGPTKGELSTRHRETGENNFTKHFTKRAGFRFLSGREGSLQKAVITTIVQQKMRDEADWVDTLPEDPTYRDYQRMRKANREFHIFYNSLRKAGIPFYTLGDVHRVVHYGLLEGWPRNELDIGSFSRECGVPYVRVVRILSDVEGPMRRMLDEVARTGRQPRAPAEVAKYTMERVLFDVGKLNPSIRSKCQALGFPTGVFPDPPFPLPAVECHVVGTGVVVIPMTPEARVAAMQQRMEALREGIASWVGSAS